jgi:hypothetical protein
VPLRNGAQVTHFPKARVPELQLNVSTWGVDSEISPFRWCTECPEGDKERNAHNYCMLHPEGEEMLGCEMEIRKSSEDFMIQKTPIPEKRGSYIQSSSQQWMTLPSGVPKCHIVTLREFLSQFPQRYSGQKFIKGI